VVLALLVERLQGGRIGQHHPVDGFEVLRRHLAAERLEGARVGLIALAQGLVGDVGQDRREVGGRFGPALEELHRAGGGLQRQFRNARHVHAAGVDALEGQPLLGHVDELEIAILARHLLSALLVVGAAAIQVFPDIVAVGVLAAPQEEPPIGAQQQGHLHTGEALLQVIPAARSGVLNHHLRAGFARLRISTPPG
jgi:hypothetical protein